MGFSILATENTARFLEKNKIPSVPIKKMHEGRPNVLDAIKNREVGLIINSPVGKFSKYDDSYIRMTAIQKKIPYVTTMAAAQATIEGIKANIDKPATVKSLQDYHADLKKCSGEVAAKK